jgi:hypothetical protein
VGEVEATFDKLARVGAGEGAFRGGQGVHPGDPEGPEKRQGEEIQMQMPMVQMQMQ